MATALSAALRLARRAATLPTSRTHYRRSRQQDQQQEQQQEQHDHQQQQQHSPCLQRGALALGLTVAVLQPLVQEHDDTDGPAASAAAAAQPDDDVLDLVDQLSAWERLDEAKKALWTFRGSRHPEVLWREARILYLQAERLRPGGAAGPEQQQQQVQQQVQQGDPKAARARLILEGFAAVQLALQLEPCCGRAHQWMSVLRHARAELRGPLARLRCVDLIRHDMERAVQLLPGDGVPRTMLAMWFYEVSQLNWLERQAVKAAGQTAPGSAECLSQALHWLLEADALYTSCLNDLMLGRTLLAMGDPQRARPYVERAARRAPRDQSDVKAQREAAQLLSTWRH